MKASVEMAVGIAAAGEVVEVGVEEGVGYASAAEGDMPKSWALERAY